MAFAKTEDSSSCFRTIVPFIHYERKKNESKHVKEGGHGVWFAFAKLEEVCARRCRTGLGLAGLGVKQGLGSGLALLHSCIPRVYGDEWGGDVGSETTYNGAYGDAGRF